MPASRKSEAPSKATIELGRRIQEERRELHATQVQIAEAAGMDVSTIRRLEHGENQVSLHSLIALADALGIDTADLTRGMSIDLLPQRDDTTSAHPTLSELKRTRDLRRRVRGQRGAG
ncbi:helix-turn-helix transcriptional regulator [Gryllotalpicola sp.]|uniref:helix-turn-helix domain-containing protein n=1 Tax=Gryllotalpicola sp. TaxID=1932787 RepID=UPI00262AF0C0|nr:helix-turn-helix transcriptional regulator [Gryllotalpicola sp.]